MNNVLIPGYMSSILTVGKNCTSDGGGEDRWVAVPGLPKLAGIGLLQKGSSIGSRNGLNIYLSPWYMV
jgi:hypothetical protein